MKTLKEKIEVMQAALDGKEIELRLADTEAEWIKPIIPPVFDWNEFDYRIKPEPMEFWVDVLLSDNRIIGVHSSKEEAEIATYNIEAYYKTIKVREVIE